MSRRQIHFAGALILKCPTTLHRNKYHCTFQTFQNENTDLKISWIGLWYLDEFKNIWFFLFFKSYFGQLKTPRSSWRNKPVDDLPCFHNPSGPGPYLFSESEIIFGLGAVAKNLKYWKISKISNVNQFLKSWKLTRNNKNHKKLSTYFIKANDNESYYFTWTN